MKRPGLLLALVLALTGCGPDDPMGEDAPQAAPELAEPTLDGPVGEEALFDHVTERARTLAGRPYAPPDTTLPGALASLDYDAYRSIRFRPDRALWRGEGRFEVQFFHRGFLFRNPVRVHVLEGDSVSTLPFDGSAFAYEGTAASAAVETALDLGYAGFRVHYPLNDPESKDEVAVFLGASYFRLLAADHVHGLSGRGLAVDTASEEGEEFPDFVEFWFVRPEDGAETFTFFGLLDGPSVAGAYRFLLDPGARTELSVEARLFARRDVGKLGVAPLTSMYLFGPGEAHRFDDFRPRVHDSDGLLMRTGSDEWIWRPLSNGPGLRVTSLRDVDPRGFGLLQRERDFRSYLDLEARYHRRPSKWVEVEGGDWGGGGVELVEIPTTSEFNDNIVAYWVPDASFGAGEERRYRYRVTALEDVGGGGEVARVRTSISGWDALPGEADPPPRSRRRFVVDFEGGPVQELPPEAEVEPVLETLAGEITAVRTQPLPGGEGWRVTFSLEPDGERVADMRLFLAVGGTSISETWSYLWDPAAIP